jgi:5'-methylthioadenosine phosphorylase
MTGRVIGVIGGSGLYQIDGLADVEWRRVESPFGPTSDEFCFGALDGQPVVFLPRHGRGHVLPPSAIPFRANIDALKRCGVTDVLAISAIGSLREELKPGDFVAVDQFIDRTLARERSFFGEGVVAHVGLADPVCPRLSKFAANAVKKAGAAVHRGGTYVAIEGPQFSTRAESHLYREWKADVIGMTALPEARLAREAELPYALLGMVTEYDAWREAEAGVEASEILAVMRANADIARQALTELAGLLPKERAASPIDRTLDTALVTPRGAWSPASLARLDAVMRRLLGQEAVPD